MSTKKKTPIQLQLGKSLESVVEQCSYEIMEDVTDQLRNLEFSLTMFGWGEMYVSLDGEAFGKPLQDWRKNLLYHLKDEIKDGCVKDDPQGYYETLKVLKECVSVLEKERAK